MRANSGRIKKSGPRRTQGDPSTLEPVQPLEGARMLTDDEASGAARNPANAERLDKHRDAISVKKVATVSSLSLLHCCEHNTRATYERIWCIHLGENPKPFNVDVT